MQQDINEYLKALSANCGREPWIRIGGAFKSAGGDFETFDQWSQTAPERYDAPNCRSTWNSLTPSGNPEGAAGLLRKLAKEAGAVFPDEPMPRRIAPPPPPPAAPSIQPPQHIPNLPPGGVLKPAFNRDPFKNPFDSDAMERYITECAENKSGAEDFFCKKRGLSSASVSMFRLGFDAARNAGVIPYPSADHHTEYCVRRYVDPKPGQSKYENPKGSKPVFNENALKQSEKPVFILEGQIDALSIIDAGGQACTGSNEKKTLIELAKTSNVPGFIIIADRDPDGGGEKKARDMKSDLKKETHRQCEVVLMPDDIHDANEFLQKRGLEALQKWVQETEKKIRKKMDTFETLAEVWDNPPPRAPELIHGLLRQGHKMIVSGTSKAGKSFALLQLAAALAEGRDWFQTFHCERCSVLYLNLEIDRASMIDRAKNVYKALGWTPQGLGNFTFDHLRGFATRMEDMQWDIADKIEKSDAKAVFIDPVYKCGLEDENSAGVIAEFCRSLDWITAETGAAVIYCHHFAKGSQDGKAAIDRASGSGVFARDADAILTISELQEEGGYLLECILREFKSPPPLYLRFEYPLHIPAPDLEGCPLKGARAARITDTSKEAEDKAKRKEQARADAMAKIVEIAKGQKEPMPKTDFVLLVMGNLGLGRDPARAAVEALVNDGRLLEKTGEGKNRKLISAPVTMEQTSFM